MSGTRSLGWLSTLNPAQKATVRRILAEHGLFYQHGKEGWTCLVMPTTQPARYCELRHYLTGGGMARWVVERDGSVSATNEGGSLRELVPVEAVAA